MGVTNYLLTGMILQVADQKTGRLVVFSFWGGWGEDNNIGCLSVVWGVKTWVWPSKNVSPMEVENLGPGT